MIETVKLIERVTEFATNPDVKSVNKILELKQLLVSIYSKYLNIEKTEDVEKEYKDDFEFPYNDLKINVGKNFPNLDWYISVWDVHKIEYEKQQTTPKICSGLGDPIDDITDILKDLLEVKWRFENNSENDALWYFHFLMKHHSEQHLVNLLKYLKDLEG